jgi:hypothetical protein
MRANRDLVAFTAMAGIETTGFFGNLCPSRIDIAQHGYDSDYRRELRRAYVGAGAISLGLAGILSYLTQSPWPLVASGLGAAGWVVLTESALPAKHRLIPIGKPIYPEIIEVCANGRE